MGPQHPSTHGVLRLVLELDGETVRLGGADDRLSPHRHREDRRTEEVAAGDSARRADGLPERAVQQHGVLPVGRTAARPRDARARARHPRAAGGAAAHQQPPGVARHARHGSRRRVGDALLLPRARAAAQHQRAARRLPDVPELHARRRPARGSAARVPRRGPRVSRSLRPEARRVRRPADQERDLPEADAGRRHDLEGGRGRLRPGRADRARRRRRLRRPQVFPVPRLRDLRLRRADADRGRRLRALPGAHRRDAREHEDLPPGAGADHAGRRSSRSTIRGSRRRPRIASTPRWKR